MSCLAFPPPARFCLFGCFFCFLFSFFFLLPMKHMHLSELIYFEYYGTEVAIFAVKRQASPERYPSVS